MQCNFNYDLPVFYVPEIPDALQLAFVPVLELYFVHPVHGQH